MRPTTVLTSLVVASQLTTIHASKKPQVRVTTSFANFDARVMDQWSGGGGDRWTIGNDSAHPFTGREFGGGTRNDIRGTRAFGSGYTYGANDTSTLAGRGFPFGVWPLWWGDDFMGTNEYHSAKDTMRPGGQLATARVQLSNTSFFGNMVENETYYILGDVKSVTFMMISLVIWCHALPGWGKH